MKQLALPPLPYDYAALEPIISRQIMELHHDKHHLAYVNGANAAIEKLEKYRRGEMDLDVKGVLRDLSFNYNGAVLHDIFWTNMAPLIAKTESGGNLDEALSSNFGSVESFKKEFTQAAVSVEGSGWAVLWKTGPKELAVGQLEKHNLLGLNGAIPLLVLDVWEHAYYLDYQNNRAAYVEKWWDLVNWKNVTERFSSEI